MTERTISSTQSTPSVSLKKQTPLLGKGCLLLFVIHYLNNALQRYNSFLKLQTNLQSPVAIQENTDADFSVSVFLVAGEGLEPPASGL